MRTLCYYQRDGKKGWISPSALWQALRSGEELNILAPELTSLSRVLWASDAAADKLEEKWRFDAKNGLISALWCLCAVLVLFWPPLAAKMPDIVQKVLLGIFGAGIWVEIVSAVAIRSKKRLLASGNDKIRAASRKSAKLSPPAEFYRSEADFPKRSAKIAVFCLLALFLLNSTVLAFPGRPAVVFPPGGDPYVAKFPRLVIPGTRWEWRREHYAGSVVALLVVPKDEKTAWIAKVTYRVWQPDIRKDPGPWRQWAAGRLGWLTRQVSDSFWQTLPPGMEKDARVAALVEAFSDPELQGMVAEVFTQHFNEHHSMMKLTVIRLEVVEISLSDYIAIARAQNKE